MIQIVLVPTNTMVSYRGCTLRLWEGTASTGFRIKALIESLESDGPEGPIPGLTPATAPDFDGCDWIDYDGATSFDKEDE